MGVAGADHAQLLSRTDTEIAVTIASGFEDLLQRIGALRADVRDRLRWVVVNGKPLGQDHALAGRFEDRVTELGANLDDAEQAALAGQDAALGELDLANARNALLECHRVVRQSARLFNLELASAHVLAALYQLAHEPDRRWTAWVGGVVDALADCRGHVEDLEDAVTACWAQWAEVASAMAAGGPKPERRLSRKIKARAARAAGQ